MLPICLKGMSLSEMRATLAGAIEFTSSHSTTPERSQSCSDMPSGRWMSVTSSTHLRASSVGSIAADEDDASSRVVSGATPVSLVALTRCAMTR